MYYISIKYYYCLTINFLAELQGRLPIRVKLESLSEEDLYNILTVPEIPLVFWKKERMKE